MADGNLAGRVIDIRTNQGIANAKVDATPEPGGETHTAQSNENGDWGPIAVPPGHYDMTASASGFAEGVYPGIVVIENVTTTLSFGLLQSDYGN